jgi:hypothetical protein
MKSFVFSTLILASMTAGALAGSPVQLTNAQMDQVTAGAVAVGASSGANTGGAVASGANVGSLTITSNVGSLTITSLVPVFSTIFASSVPSSLTVSPRRSHGRLR